jgi:hypothetical protein
LKSNLKKLEEAEELQLTNIERKEGISENNTGWEREILD